MYSVIFHAHQKLDRAAYKQVKLLLPKNTFFPSVDNIVHFDGRLGPDNPKLKLIPEHQPWHFIDPEEIKKVNKPSSDLHKDIKWHYEELIKALRNKDEIRSAFEAAWLAHALVDGLTPSHHYPYKQELISIHGGDKTDFKGLKGRAYVKSGSLSETFKKGLKIIGPHGLITTHFLFEAGAYTIMAPMKLYKLLPSSMQVEMLATKGVIGLFNELVKEITTYDLYSRYIHYGWDKSISKDIRLELAPRMVQMVTLAWYSAAIEASA